MTQQLDPGAGAKPPLFEHGARWETIDPDETQAADADAAHEAAMLAYLATPTASIVRGTQGGGAKIDESSISPPPELERIPEVEPDAEPGDADAASEDAPRALMSSGGAAVQRAKPKQPHAPAHTTPAVKAARHSEHKRKGKPFYAAQDNLNRGTVHDNHGKNIKLARPGVVVGKDRHDEFTLIDDQVKTRYIIAKNTANVAEAHGTVSNAQIAHANGRFAANPAHVQTLEIPNEGPRDCVLTWFGPKGAAWMKVEDLKDGSRIASAANKASRHEGPRPGSSAAHNTTRFRIRAGGIATPTPADKKQYIRPHQHSTHANHKTDYLEHGPASGGGHVNLCMNLPSKHAPPVSIDVLMPGQMFFVPNEHDHKVPSKYVRQIALYGHNASRTMATQIWVFGFVGKSETEPDETRCGWLPLRVVEPAPLP